VTSEVSTIQINIYDRADEEHGFMGCVKVKPTLVHDYTVDQWYKWVYRPSLFLLSPDAFQGLVPMKMNPISQVKSAFK
jgi:hypothetical protein